MRAASCWPSKCSSQVALQARRNAFIHTPCGTGSGTYFCSELVPGIHTYHTSQATSHLAACGKCEAVASRARLCSTTTRSPAPASSARQRPMEAQRPQSRASAARQQRASRPHSRHASGPVASASSRKPPGASAAARCASDSGAHLVSLRRQLGENRCGAHACLSSPALTPAACVTYGR